jgi:hypothetical protein
LIVIGFADLLAAAGAIFYFLWYECRNPRIGMFQEDKHGNGSVPKALFL